MSDEAPRSEQGDQSEQEGQDQPGPDQQGQGKQDDESSAVLVIVIRTGGIAGMSRQWKVEPAHDERSHWIELIERCPWTDPDASQEGADRYIWSIRARTPEARHEREVPEAALDGPWRELVEAVRAATDTTLNERIVPPGSPA